MMLVDRTGEADEHRLVSRVAEPVDADRNGLRPPESRAGRDDQQDRQQDHGADRVDVADRVERQPPGALGGVVAEPVGDDAVAHLVQDHRRDEGDEEQQLFAVQGVVPLELEADRDERRDDDDRPRAVVVKAGEPLLRVLSTTWRRLAAGVAQLMQVRTAGFASRRAGAIWLPHRSQTP